MTPRPRALVLRYHSLGDVVLTTGVVRALHEAGFAVDVETEQAFRPIFVGLPFVERIRLREEQDDAPRVGTEGGIGAEAGRLEDEPSLDRRTLARPERYDRVIDLQGSPSSRRSTAGLGPICAVNTRSLARRLLVLLGNRAGSVATRHRIPHAVERYAEAAFSSALGPPPAPSLASLHPEVRVTEADRAALPAAVRDLAAPGSRPRVALLTGASRRSKAYPGERFVEVGRAFERDGWEVLWVEAPKPFATELERSPSGTQPDEGGGRGSGAPVGRRVAVPLDALKAALGGVQLAVSGDSGPMHLATALARPVVALFGSSVRGFGFAPLGPRSTVLEIGGLTCRPCGVHGRNRCWRGGFPCLAITPSAVVDAGRELVSGALIGKAGT